MRMVVLIGVTGSAMMEGLFIFLKRMLARQEDTSTSQRYWRKCAMINTLITFLLGAWVGSTVTIFALALFRRE